MGALSDYLENKLLEHSMGKTSLILSRLRKYWMFQLVK